MLAIRIAMAKHILWANMPQTALLQLFHKLNFRPFSFARPVLLGTLASAFEGVALYFSIPLVQSIFGVQGYRLGFTPLLVIVFSCFQIKLVLCYTSTTACASACRTFSNNLRTALFEASLRLERDAFASRNKGKLQTTIIEATETIANQMLAAQEMLVTALMLVIYLGIMFAISWEVTAAIAVLFPAMQFSIGMMAKSIRSASKHQRTLHGHLSAVASNVLANVQLVHSTSNESLEVTRFSEASSEAARAMVKLDNWTGFIRMAQESMSLVLLTAIAAAAHFYADPGGRHLPRLMVFVYLLRRASTSINVLGRLNAVLAAIEGPISEVGELLSTLDLPMQADGEVVFSTLRDSVEFSNVTFAYPGRSRILDGFSLRVPYGKTVAIVGMSGSGKTTAANLLLGLSRPGSGAILLDGVDLTQFKISSWRRAVGYISQDAPMFDATLRENVSYPYFRGSDEEVLTALSRAHLESLLERMPARLDSRVGDRGTQVSGGERQRISIARAIYNSPQVLILDEATNALDSETEASIRESILELARGRTSLIIAHRLATVRDADKIVVLEGGRVCEEGRWAELIAHGGRFSELVAAQA